MVININIKRKVHSIEFNSKKYNFIYKISDELFNDFDVIKLVKKIITEDSFDKFIFDADLNFYIVIWSDDYLFCCVDHICSYQLVYNLKNDCITISDEIDKIENNQNKDVEKSIYYSGYSIKDGTLDKYYKSLLPCQYILWKKDNFKVKNYYNTEYLYSNDYTTNKSLEDIITKLFFKLKKKYFNSNIIVPLSSGMDSRLIISAMKYFEFPNIKIFSYSYQNKRDTHIAYKLAKYLNYPFKLINLNIANCKNIYRSEYFKNYLDYKNCGNAVNNPGDFLSIHKLMKEKFITKNSDIIINGQAGDFISGNHIPLFLFEEKNKSIDYLLNKTLDYIIFKHFNLWSEEKINEDQFTIRDYIKKNYFDNISTWKNIISSYEKFEFENRQVKWVVGQQKVYDYFGLNWSLPLWSTSIMNFFSKDIHVDQRKNQSFYREFLIKKNYGGVWKKIPINPREKFSIMFRFLRFNLKLLFIILGKKKWKKFERKYLSYFMDNALVTTCYDYTKFVKSKKIIRNTVAFLAQDYLYKKK